MSVVNMNNKSLAEMCRKMKTNGRTSACLNL